MLVGLTVVQDFLGIAQSDTTYNPVLNFISEAVSTQIESWCHRAFAAATVIEYFDIEDQQSSILLSRFPIITVVALTNDGTAVASGDYKVYGSQGIIKLADRITLVSRRYDRERWLAWGKQTTECMYRGGYTTIPYDIQLVTLGATTRWFNTRDKQGLASEAVGGYRYQMTDPKDLMSGFTVQELSILQKYQRVLLYEDENG